MSPTASMTSKLAPIRFQGIGCFPTGWRSGRRVGVRQTGAPQGWPAHSARRRRRNSLAGPEPLWSSAMRYHLTASSRRPARRSRSARIEATVFDRASLGSSATSSSAAKPAGEPVAETDRQRAVGPRHGGVGDLDQPVVGRRRSPPSRSAASSAPSRVPPRSPPAADRDLVAPAASCSRSSPRVIRPRSQRLRSCSSSGTSAPSASTRVSPSRIVQQHKGGQRVRIALVGHQRAQFTGQAHALVAQLVADRRRSRRRPVALGEHRVDAGRARAVCAPAAVRRAAPAAGCSRAGSCSWPG